MEKELLEWYEINHRNLPWRKNGSAYAIWISEIMAQQTRIDTMLSYYIPFMEKFPTIQSLSEAPMEVLLKQWQGLGYYSRARNLKKAAEQIMERHHGVFPKDYQEVIKLAGIGPYTAGAILSMAYGLPFAAIDGNALRVFSRYFRVDKDIQKEDTKKYWKQEVERMELTNYGLFNQAIMDLGAMICLPNEAPKCSICPLQSSCLAHQFHEELNFPVKKKPMAKALEEYTVFLIQLNDKILLHKRSNYGLLAGLYEFPNMIGHHPLETVKNLFRDDLIRIQPGPKKTHIFTHKKWVMYSYLIQLSDYQLKEDEDFYTMTEIADKISIPQAFLQFLSVFK